MTTLRRPSRCFFQLHLDYFDEGQVPRYAFFAQIFLRLPYSEIIIQRLAGGRHRRDAEISNNSGDPNRELYGDDDAGIFFLRHPRSRGSILSRKAQTRSDSLPPEETRRSAPPQPRSRTDRAVPILGIKNILLGPSLPAFVSQNVLNYLVENFNITPISTPEADLKKILGQ
jgi:hypothetical protein